MRIAVAGGTGLVGRHVVEVLREGGHAPVALARSQGIDLLTGGDPLVAALEGAEAVIDVTNTPTTDPELARQFFTGVTATLTAAEEKAGVRHHVVLSIVGLDRIEGNGHYAGKRAQEVAAREAWVPATIVRGTQFFEFAEMVVGWTRRGDQAVVPPLLIQPLAVRDLAAVLVEVAAGPPADSVIEVAGPEPQDMVDMARRALAARGDLPRLVPSWRGPFGAEMAGEVLLPTGSVRLTPTTFDAWLADQAADDGTVRRSSQ